MKKYFATICASAVLFCSCSNDSLISSAPDKAISYGVTAGNLSRAANSYGPNVQPDKFKVWAATPGAANPYLNGRTITRTGTVWADSETQYWPASELNFFAVVNDDDNKFDFNSGAPRLSGFTTKSDVTRQVDLMYATAFNCSSKQPNVALHFYHALAQVGFKAICTNTRLSVTIKSIEIGNINSTATFSFPLSAQAEGTWSDFSAPSVFSVPLPAPLAIGSTSTNLTNAENGDYSRMLMLIPQTVEAWTPQAGESSYDGAYFLVDCTIIEKATNTTLRNGKIAMPVSIDWQQGKRYVYTFTFSNHTGGFSPDPDNPIPVMTPIGYDVSVKDFIEAGDTDLPATGDETGDDTPSGDNLVGPVIECNGKKFRFTSGNLQYNDTDHTWNLAESQASCLGANGTGKDVIDLFGWGATGLGDARQPTYSGSTASNYPSTRTEDNMFTSEAFKNIGNFLDTDFDWGTAYGSGTKENGYFTPTLSDWEYILDTYICCGAYLTLSPQPMNPGLLILPCETEPEAKDLLRSLASDVLIDNNWKRITKSNTNQKVNFTGVYLSLDQLKEINGVFLPSFTLQNDNSSNWYYWTANCAGTDYATALKITFPTNVFGNDPQTKRNTAMAVRLAKTVE